MSSNLLSITLPSSRADGSALSLAELASVTITKNGQAFPGLSGPFTSVSQTATDNAPDQGGTDVYVVTVTDTKGNVSAPATASINDPPLSPPAAPTVTVTFQP